MPSGIRKGLTPAKILEESFALVDAGGASALTMRALAQRLGVAAMAIYNHYRDRDAILDALAEQTFAQLQQSASGKSPGAHTGKDWKTKLRLVLTGAKNLASRHPHIFRLALTRPNKPPSALTLTAEAYQWLCEAGLPSVQALTLYHTFVMLLQGFPFWQESFELHPMKTARSGGNMAVSCDPELLFPPGWNADKQFEASIDWLLDCVEQLTCRSSKPKRAKQEMARKL